MQNILSVDIQTNMKFAFHFRIYYRYYREVTNTAVIVHGIESDTLSVNGAA